MDSVAANAALPPPRPASNASAARPNQARRPPGPGAGDPLDGLPELIRFRAGHLANCVAVLAADFGFREAVASGDVPTILSAARNNAQRIGADIVLLLDTHGGLLASTAPETSAGDTSLEGLLLDTR